MKKTTQEWVEEFEALGIACGPVNTIDKVAHDPQVRHREMIREYSHTRLGKVKAVNTPVKLSRTPTGNDASSPDLGEHTDDLLRGLLGMDDQQIAALREDGVI